MVVFTVLKGLAYFQSDYGEDKQTSFRETRLDFSDGKNFYL